MNSTPGRAKIFNIPGLQALSGAFQHATTSSTSPPEKIPSRRPRVQSDFTPYVATFGERLSTRNQQVMAGGSNDSS